MAKDLHSLASFETERLWIRPTSAEDAGFFLQLLNSPKWLKYIGDRNVHNLDAARQYIENRIIPQFARLGFASYTIVTKHEGQSIGTCGLYDREGVDGVDIGFALLPEFEGLGYAFEASRRLLIAAVRDFELNRLSAITLQDNLASQKLLRKLGLQFTSWIKLPKEEVELMLFELPISVLRSLRQENQ